MDHDKGIKVLMLGWEFAPIIAGGLGVACRGLANGLIKNHADITYVLPRIPEHASFGGDVEESHLQFKSAEIDLTGMKVIGVNSGLNTPYASYYPQTNPLAIINLPLAAAGNTTDPHSSPKTAAGNAIYGKDLLNEVDAYAHNVLQVVPDLDDYDVIHNHDWMTVPAAIKAKEHTGKPMVMHVHATEIDRTLNHPHPKIFATELEGMKAADVIIAVSELTKQKIVSNYGIDPQKVIVVHNAVERIETKHGLIAKSLHKDDQIVLFLARLTAMKGANYLLEAAAKVLPILPKTKFVFVGAGELLEELIERSVDLDIAHKVTFTGFLPHDQVDRAYRSANVFVMPSVSEPFGIAPLEAIKNGTPVIISKQSGVSEVLKNVLKVDFWDTDELANKLIAVLKYGVLAEELSNNSKHELERISWDEQSRKVIDIYSTLKHSLP